MQICRVEDIDVSGLVQGTVINFNRARSVTVQTSGTISATGLGMIICFYGRTMREVFTAIK